MAPTRELAQQIECISVVGGRVYICFCMFESLFMIYDQNEGAEIIIATTGRELVRTRHT
jgi:superfamily II DNA/RNA helicase